MPTLTYRGKAYIQNKEAGLKQFVELTYRRNVYINRKKETATQNQTLKYRGLSYKKQ